MAREQPTAITSWATLHGLIKKKKKFKTKNQKNPNINKATKKSILTFVFKIKYSLMEVRYGMFYLTTHSTHFSLSYMLSNIRYKGLF